MGYFSGFSKKSRAERIDALRQAYSLDQDQTTLLLQDHNLPLEIAGQLAENHLGTFALPYSLLPELTVNGQSYSLPMVTEEPSVVAAASYAAKILSKSGGVTTTIQERLMIGQVALYDVPDLAIAHQELQHHQDRILQAANQAHPSIVKRGGGCRRISVEVKEDFLIVYLHVDVQEAMGANILNTMLEGVSPLLEDLTQGKTLMAILSNYATESLVTATCRVPIRYLEAKKELAFEAGQKMALASHLAQIDPYRAATHNKGIFNGIDALVIASGNDWRAIEAGAHAYASRSGQYRGLSSWHLEDQTLVGTLTLPMPIATVGGSIGLNPKVRLTHDLLGHPDAKTLAGLIAALGLAQNFAALKALVTSGIQSGHMKLQAKSLALHAGALPEEISPLVARLQTAPHMNLETTQNLLQELRQSAEND